MQYIAAQKTNCTKNLKEVSETTPPTLVTELGGNTVGFDCVEGKALELTKGRNGPSFAHTCLLRGNGGLLKGCQISVGDAWWEEAQRLFCVGGELR